mmetsp:Transcript_1550/g.3495  ORF Transcript_1550/g.3495 Transcript_1550/m.3495 type:complete len:85 (-) Transcript_1550:43-297(-)
MLPRSHRSACALDQEAGPGGEELSRSPAERLQPLLRSRSEQKIHCLVLTTQCELLLFLSRRALEGSEMTEPVNDMDHVLSGSNE